jgi:ribosomal protein S18 acetylase RimI-like enzyme
VTLERLESADGEPFRQLFAIYAASITPREQKPEGWLRAMVASPDYSVWIAQTQQPDASAPVAPAAAPLVPHVLGFSILYMPPGEGFALLEYMAVALEKRGRGFGGELFRRTVEHAVNAAGARLPVVLEVDSDREAASDQAVRTRRLRFYRGLGCVRIAGLSYLMPLGGVGPAPEMDLMVYRAEPLVSVPRSDLKRWLQTIYRDVYHCSPDDPRIERMLEPLPDPVLFE